MVIVDLEGHVRESNLQPSSDTASHLYIYRHRADVAGIVHTHSPYATAFAANRRSIPVYLTAPPMSADRSPAGSRAHRGEEIGQVVVDTIGDRARSCSRTTACLR
jgi:L-ribulose-5-phosphate 4-epimerase